MTQEEIKKKADKLIHEMTEKFFEWYYCSETNPQMEPIVMNKVIIFDHEPFVSIEPIEAKKILKI